MLSSAVALLLVASSELAAEPASDPSCPRPENVIAVLQKHFPGTKLTRIEGAHARRFVDAYNSQSGSTRWPADEVVIARNPDTPERARIGFFKNGCLLALVARSLWTVDSLQRSIMSEQEI
jgi:hypothetical protein